MPVPIIFGVIAGGAAIYGAIKGVSGAIDHSNAKNINTEAQSTVDEANHKVEEQRKTTFNALEKYGKRKLSAFESVIADFLKSYKKLNNVEINQTHELDKLGIGDFSSQSLTGLSNDYQALQDAGLGLGAGLGGGAALAFGAYNGTMLLATAGTGTAISSLSGVAATNATLAWLGGGTLAAGGGGMALGTMVLGGIVAGPALAIFGHILGNKGEEALNNARSNMEQALSIRAAATLTVSKLQAIEKITSLASQTFQQITIQLRHSTDALTEVIETYGNDYRTFNQASQETVHRAVKFAQLAKAMIDTPILDKNGNMILATQKRIEELQAVITA
ncbi:hypothetical protein [Malikia sp.]|uniref:hypothetical protein n=1 Tax=Malikia sp. TaxID=2070706 RepID=UPI00263869D4|nr:hypothetical protein [Malikia sp.]MDD2729035.1 hypothetical protein [Malikia sp.]